MIKRPAHIFSLFLSPVRLPVIRLFWILFAYYQQPAAYCQLSKTDSLQHIVRTAKADTTKANTLNQLAMEFKSNNPDTAIYFARQALTLSEKIKYKKGIAEAYLWMGTAITNTGKYDDALNYLSKALAETRDKKITSKIFNNIGNIYYNQGNYSEALKNYFTSLKIREEIDDKQGIAASYNNIGNVYNNLSNHPEALKNHFASLKIKEEIGDKLGIAYSYNNIGTVYESQGNYPEALESYFASLKIRKDIGDKQGIAASYNNIGNIYYNQGNYSEALKNHFAALKIREEIGDKSVIASSYNNIGNVYYSQGNYTEVLKNYFTALKIGDEIGDKRGMADAYNNIGLVYESHGNYYEALKNHFAALKIREEIGNKQGITMSYVNIGNINTATGKAREGKEWQEKALKFSKEIGYKEGIKASYAGLAKADSVLATSPLTPLQRRGELAMSALENYKMYVLYKDSLINEETIKKTERAKNQYEFGQKEAKAEAERQKKEAIAEAERKKQQIILWLVIGGLLLVILFAGFIFRSLRITKKQKQIIEEQKDIVDIRNKEIEEQKKIVEEKNKDITDSINYAKRIQQAKLPDIAEIQKALPDSFVLFKPKDIVSGDFYYFTPLSNSPLRGENFNIGIDETPSLEGRAGEGFFIAAADCTGHGVPGAFMSMIGSEKLDEAVAKSSDTSEILSYLNRGIKKSLQQTGNDGSTRDGMDIALVRIDLPGFQNLAGLVTISYAGANRPLWIIRKGSTEVQEIKATKKAIGGFTENSQHFDTHEIELSKGDTFYISTDGYADTFGGQDHKKIMTKRFKEILVEIQNKTMQEQEKHLNDFVENWKGEKEQVDDILVIGVRL